MKMFSGEGDILKYSNNSIVQMTTCFFRYLLSSFYCVAHRSKCHVKGKEKGVKSAFDPCSNLLRVKGRLDPFFLLKFIKGQRQT